MYDVVALGELLIDFIPNGKSEQGNTLYEANPGGAPCNVLSMLSKLGKSTIFIGKVGNDNFGKLLKNTIQKVSIDAKALQVSDDVNTTLAFVQNDEKGERCFTFYRNPGADMTLSPEEINEEMIQSSKIFHFGSLSMTHPDVREATRKAVNVAKEKNIIVSFDPNFRPLLWKDFEEAKKQMLFGCSVCDILKIEEEELKFITGIHDIDNGVDYLKEHFHIPLIMVTSGAKGSRAYYRKEYIKKEAFLTDKTIDTTGAGDTFCAVCLSYVLDYGLSDLDNKILEEMLMHANAAASIVTKRKGAICSMPEKNEIEELIHNADKYFAI